MRKLHLMPRWSISAEKVRKRMAELQTSIPMTDAEIVDALAEMVRRNNEALIYDHLGIKTDLRTLPSWDEYTELRRKKDQRGLLAFIRRYLFPKRYKQLWQAYLDAQLRIQDEFLNEVLSQ